MVRGSANRVLSSRPWRFALAGQFGLDRPVRITVHGGVIPRPIPNLWGETATRTLLIALGRRRAVDKAAAQESINGDVWKDETAGAANPDGLYFQARGRTG